MIILLAITITVIVIAIIISIIYTMACYNNGITITIIML